jgi:mannan endo-1,4-beta-mannosidase
MAVLRKGRRAFRRTPLAAVTLPWVIAVMGCASEVTIGFLETDESPPTDDSESSSTGGTATDIDTGTGTCDAPTMYVEGGQLHDVCGRPFVPIGVNEMLGWSKTNPSGAGIFSEIKKTGANTVRFVWTADLLDSSLSSVEELDAAIVNSVANRLIPFPEFRPLSKTLFGLSQAVEWWTKPEVMEVVARHERFLMLSLSNGAGEAGITPGEFVAAYGEAIAAVRAAGIRIPIVVEASDEGSDIEMLRQTFTEIQSRDPLSNLMFSVHIWWAAPDGSTDRITHELQASADVGMPLIVSEFAPMKVFCEQRIDVEAILRGCRAHGFGFFPWSWGGEVNTDCFYMNMTTDGIYGHWQDTPDNGRWGERVAVTDPNSIQHQSVEVFVFSTL